MLGPDYKISFAILKKTKERVKKLTIKVLDATLIEHKHHHSCYTNSFIYSKLTNFQYSFSCKSPYQEPDVFIDAQTEFCVCCELSFKFTPIWNFMFYLKGRRAGAPSIGAAPGGIIGAVPGIGGTGGAVGPLLPGCRDSIELVGFWLKISEIIFLLYHITHCHIKIKVNIFWLILSQSLSVP